MVFGMFRRKDKANGARPPDDTVVYAVGDIHGCLGLLLSLQRQIAEDMAGREASRRVIVYLGDYIDRGPDSRGVIEHLASNPLPDCESVHLMGNHDRWLLDFLDDPGCGEPWLMNGARPTLSSYGVANVSGESLPARLQALRDGLDKALPAHHRAFFEGLRHSHAEGDYFFAHAGVRPGVPLEEQEPHDLLWIREEFLYSDEDFGKVVVHGHTPGHTPEDHRNRIAVDTGAFMSGRLTAAVLEGTKRRFLYGQGGMA